MPWESRHARGAGKRPLWASLSDRDCFHALDEACWPAPLQDVGKRLAEDGHEIAEIMFTIAGEWAM